jgi:2-amino-4-hydroxy-6-hydroxymethyldihydropteridine diphosphokinase
LLLYGEHSINTPKLVVPHPGLYERNFVLYPLAELVGERAETLMIPGKGTLASLLEARPRGNLQIVNH